MLLIDYTCPECGHKWQEVFESACDSNCPKCGLKNIEAESWRPSPEQD